MPLSADAQALLELILAKDQSYEDIAGLLDVPADEVRGRARDALRELSGGADPDRNVALTDWLLGQADPIGRAEAVRHLREDPEDNALAAELLDSLAAIAPDADLPRLPGAPSPRRRVRERKAEKPSGPSISTRLSSLDSRQTKLIAVLGSAALILIVVVLVIAGGSGDDEPSTTADTSETTADTSAGTEEADAGNSVNLELKPVGDSDAAGVLGIGVADQTQAFVDVAVQNLQPPPNDSTYILWFMQDEKSGYPYQELAVSPDGSADERFSLPQEFLSAMLSSKSVDIWISPIDEVQDLVASAVRKASLVDVPGERVLTADVRPVAEAAGAAAQGGGAQAGG